MTKSSLHLISAFVAGCMLMGCAPRKIPGTEIDDTDDTRTILDVVEKYRRAVEAKDAQTLVDLADASFKDDGGSSNPDDDLDYKTLHTALPARLARLDDVKLEINVRKVEVDEENNTARATYTYATSFRMPSLTSKPQSESEIKQMLFRRIDKRVWKITSGI